jgi:hypothetical protein
MVTTALRRASAYCAVGFLCCRIFVLSDLCAVELEFPARCLQTLICPVSAVKHFDHD